MCLIRRCQKTGIWFSFVMHVNGSLSERISYVYSRAHPRKKKRLVLFFNVNLIVFFVTHYTLTHTSCL